MTTMTKQSPDRYEAKADMEIADGMFVKAGTLFHVSSRNPIEAYVTCPSIPKFAVVASKSAIRKILKKLPGHKKEIRQAFLDLRQAHYPDASRKVDSEELAERLIQMPKDVFETVKAQFEGKMWGRAQPTVNEIIEFLGRCENVRDLDEVAAR